MPRRDGTGPWGNGSRKGKGFGICNGTNFTGSGNGLGRGLGLGNRRGSGILTGNSSAPKTQKELLQEQKKILEKELSSINKQLEGL